MLDELEAELVSLYKDTAAARRVADYAGIPTSFIELDGPIIEVWHRIIEQADRRGKLADLLAVTIRDYPQREKLAGMLIAYNYGVRSAKDAESFSMSLPRGGATSDPSQVADLVRRLEVIVRGSEQYNVEGLVVSVKRMEVKIDTLTSEVAALKDRQATNRRILIALSAVCLALLVAVGVLVFQSGVGMA